ncbi:MAG TPA: hypothetical protein VJT71_20300 [Pyrinomonadaceae bacterium]|nr:hypothetical protein [Pyrinomonadaceae bacterium]
MRGISADTRHEPVANPSWLGYPAAKAPGWGINGPGVSAEWTQGGESEWNSVNASADESRAAIWQDVEIPRAGDYKFWVRYADWADRSENFTVRITQQGRDVFTREFGTTDVIDPHDEIKMYWQWAFAWDGARATLAKGPARVSIEIQKTAQASRQVDCFVLTNDLGFAPQGRQKPDFAAARHLREFARSRPRLDPLIEKDPRDSVAQWSVPKLAGQDFLMPWNIPKQFWPLYDKPADQRPLYLFHAEPFEEFVKTYSGKQDVPIFNSKFIVPVIYINDMAELLKDGSQFRRYLSETKQPFAILINYGAASFPSETDAKAALEVLNGELRGQFLGWISGESIGHVFSEAPQYLKLSPDMSRTQMLAALRVFYTTALIRKWSATFRTPSGPMWDKLIPAQATSSTSFAHALGEWGVRTLGMETAALQPMTAMRIAFTRGAARQFGGAFVYYHAPNFGDTAITFTRSQNFAGPDNFFHSHYGVTMGPSLSWYRKSYYLYYMSGASAIYLEQGFDQFFKPGPGEHPFQLNPLGRITDEFIRFAARHPNRGVAYTPVAFVLDPAHGWDMTDYPHWPFGASQISRGDRALRELFGAAYYPGLVREGEPASGERQAFVPGIFGNIFDVLVASETQPQAIDKYRALIAGGDIAWTPGWAQRLTEYVNKGGVAVLNSAQTKGLSEKFLGVHLTGATAEADDAKCLIANEPNQNLRGQMFRYERSETKGAQILLAAPNGDPLVTSNKVGRGRVLFVALPDLLGEDERLTPFVAHLLTHLFSNVSPVQVDGDVEYLVNRNERGWVVTIFNDNGVFKPQQGLAQVDRSATVTAAIRLRDQKILEAAEWLSETKLSVQKTGEVSVNIPAGGVAIVELRF